MARLSRTLTVLALGSALTATAEAKSPTTSVDQLLRQLRVSRGDAYLAARDQLVRLGPEAHGAVRARLEKAAWTPRSWRDDLTAAVADSWLAAPELASKAYALRGLQPQVYLGNRRPQPTVASELLQSDIPAPVLFELYLSTFERYPFSKADDFPPGTEAALITQHQAQERAALAEGVLFALGRSGHPAAPHLLGEVLLDARAPLGARSIAAQSLAETGSVEAFATLKRALSGVRASDPLRPAVVAAFGSVRSDASLAVLQAEAKAGASLEAKRTAVAALGLLGSSWVHEAAGTDPEGELRGKVATTLAGILASPDGEALEDALVEALAMTAHAPTAAHLKAQGADEGASEAQRRRAERAANRMVRRR